jgi:hypothetical protein
MSRSLKPSPHISGSESRRRCRDSNTESSLRPSLRAAHAGTGALAIGERSTTARLVVRRLPMRNCCEADFAPHRGTQREQDYVREHTMSYQDFILESQREIQRQQQERARKARLLRIRHLRHVKLAVRDLLRGVK